MCKYTLSTIDMEVFLTGFAPKFAGFVLQYANHCTTAPFTFVVPVLLYWFVHESEIDALKGVKVE